MDLMQIRRGLMTQMGNNANDYKYLATITTDGTSKRMNIPIQNDWLAKYNHFILVCKSVFTRVEGVGEWIYFMTNRSDYPSGGYYTSAPNNATEASFVLDVIVQNGQFNSESLTSVLAGRKTSSILSDNNYFSLATYTNNFNEASTIKLYGGNI